ncbi:hypothetical protein BW686_25360 [Pseudomonas syringae]|uniref:Uncharacterized protein n=1 Tax=Pseudomonas syringae TaxID=317 RepID=A0A244EJL8_PSESX|nr:hypothetical protein [Pseudomonas syringae]OUM04650.1 hypothetical protein BW686_25360 [Pseudomonas syringae]
MKETARLIACTFIFCSAVVAANPNSRPSAELIAPAAIVNKQDPTAPQATITKQESELLLIKEQNRLIKDFQSSQQATVYWALGGIFSFVLILTGLSILTNFKLYDQDKERLRAEFEGKINAYKAQFDLQIEEYKRESDKSSDQKSQVIQDRFLLQLSETRKLSEGIRSELISDIKSTDNNIKKLETSLTEVNRKFAEADADLRDVEVLVWDLKDIPGNMLITYSQGLTAAVEASNKSRVSLILGKIVNTLENKYYRTGLDIPFKTNGWLTESLNEANQLDPSGVAKVRATLAKITIEEEIKS